MIKTLKRRIISLLFVVLAAVCTVFTAVQPSAFALAESNKNYSDVLSDLTKDTSFSAEYYPEKADDYSLQVIQIAESTDKELFVYVYQPSGQAAYITASSINVSTTLNDYASWYNYRLEYLNHCGVFFKYKVKGFMVKDDAVRYYVITSIYRPFDETLGDKQAEHDNKVTEVNYNVSKQYCFSTINGKPYVNVLDIETITITDKFVGFVRYEDGFNLYVGACDSHFVAFNTDKPIDKLLEADVFYTTQKCRNLTVSGWGGGHEVTFGEKDEDCYKHLDSDQKGEHNGGGLFGSTYTWERIEKVEDFIAKEDRTKTYSGAILDVTCGTKLTDEALEALKNKKWLLRFVESDYIAGGIPDKTIDENFTIVGDVTILRLKFETDGITYNLGTIDNKQTGSDTPSNESASDVDLSDELKELLAKLKELLAKLKKGFQIVLLIVLLALLSPILLIVVRFVFWVLSLPFKLISSLSRKLKKNRGKNNGKKT